MALLVNKLITQAFKLAGLYQNDRNIDGFRITETLDILNELLDSNSANPTLIAFYRLLQFPITSSKSEYTFSRDPGADVDSDRIVDIKHVAVISGGIRYPVKVIDDYEYYISMYNTNSVGRPSSLILQNNIDVSTLTFLPAPDRSYTAEIKAKFVLKNISLNADITDVPAYYIRYLKFALAKELCFEYMPENWNQFKEQELMKLQNRIESMSDVDMSLRMSDALVGNRRFAYNRIGVIT